MAEYLWSHLTPWVKDDMRKVTDADAVAALHNVPFVGIHIRRGDKITQHEAKFYDVEVSCGSIQDIHVPYHAQIGKTVFLGTSAKYTGQEARE